MVKVEKNNNKTTYVYLQLKPEKPYTIQDLLNDFPEIKQNAKMMQEIENRFLVNLDEQC